MTLSLNCSFGQARPDLRVINYSAYNKPLKLVLKDLSRISGVNFVYSESRMPINKLVSINAKNETLGDILKVILDDFSVSYKIVGNQLVLVKEDKRRNLPKNAILNGYLIDSETGEFLIGAGVFLHNKSQSTVTNDFGFFSFKVARETQRVHFEYVGYKTAVLEFFVQKDSVLKVGLEPDALLNEVVIIDKVTKGKHENTNSEYSIHRDKILSSNHLAGEADVFRYLSTLPGVSSGADGIGGLNVRGGSADQNLVLLDGVPLYNTGHALGIFSVFNANSIKSVNFYNGGIPARYAGRLSSVIDVHTKDGNYQKINGDFTLSSIAASGTLEGPIVKNKSSFLVSFRRTHLDVWIKQLTSSQFNLRGRDGEANYFFNDLNMKLNFQVGKKSRLLLSTLLSNDLYKNGNESSNPNTQYDQREQRLGWGNELHSIRFNTQFNKKLFSRATAYYTRYNFSSFRKNRFEIILPNKDTTFIFDASLFDSKVQEYGVRKEWDYIPNTNHTIKFGIAGVRREFKPRTTNTDAASFPNQEKNISFEQIKTIAQSDTLYGDEVNVYYEDEILVGSGVKLHGGLNYSLFRSVVSSNTKLFHSLEPRLALLASGDKIHFKLGISKQHQNLHLLTNDGLGLPTDVWVPASNILAPQTSWIFNTAFGYRNERGYQFGADVYYKTLKNISTFREGGGLDINAVSEWEIEIPTGNGSAYGFELYAEKEIGSNVFSSNYTWASSVREFPDINTGQKYDFGFNRKHSFKFSYIFRLSQFSEFLVNWTYQSGNKFSLPTNLTINPSGSPVVYFPAKNNAYFPEYHRLDVGFTFYNDLKWARSKLNIGLFNAYNKKNPFYNELIRDTKNNGRFVFNQYSLPSILPTISYGLAF